MSRWTTPASILLGLGLLLAGHGYLWVRFVRDAGLSSSIVRSSAWILGALAVGIRVLSNERVELKRHGHAIHLAGIVDHEAVRLGLGPAPNLDRAVAGRDRSRPLILLAHRPGAIREAVRHGVDLQLSGHTHGGQLWPLGWLLRLGHPIVAGLTKVGDTVVYVSRGTGHSGPPMRLGAPAEVTALVLRAEPSAKDGCRRSEDGSDT